MEKFFFIVGAFMLLCIACNKDDCPPNYDYLNNYVGSYKVLSEQTAGLFAVYDSVGTQIGYEEQTHIYTDTIDIVHLLNTDTLIIENLIQSISGISGKTVKAVVINDTIWVNHNESTQIYSDILNGYFHLSEDSISFNYNWNRSDIWSTGAIPQYGAILGSGIRLD